MEPIRILELRVTYRDGGGPDKTILLSAKMHDRARYDVQCVYLRNAEDHAFNIGHRARAMGVAFEEVLERGRIDPRALAQLALRFRQLRPHIIHTHDYKSDILGFLLRPVVPSAVLLATAHGWTLDNKRMDLYNRADRWVLRHFDHVIAVSGATRERLLETGIDPRRLSILYNGIDTHAWRPGPHEVASAALKGELGLPPSARLLGFIGRLSPEKDVPIAMEVARRVLEQAPDTHVIVIGDGAMQDELPGMVSSLGLTGRVHLLGHRPVTSAVYHALDVYYMTSRTEGLPNTLLEAMACGIPSVVTAVGGIPELVGDSEGALLNPAGDAGPIADGILSLLRDPARHAAVAGAARRRIEEAFSFDQRMRRIEAVYDALAAGRRPSDAPADATVGAAPRKA